jgi:drug/metabolite transporter (DMT)-like permease
MCACLTCFSTKGLIRAKLNIIFGLIFIRMKKNLSLVYFGLVLTMFFWGLTFVFFKFAYESFKPISIIFIRLIISTVLLYFFSKVLGKFQKIAKKDLRFIFLLAFFEPFMYFMGESFGLTYVSATLAAVIISLIPLIIPVFAYIFYREKLSRVNTIGLLISFTGVLLVVFSNGTELLASLKGFMLMLLAVMAAVGYTLTVKRLAHKYTGFTITCYQNAIGAGLFLPFFLVFDLPSFNMDWSTNSVLAILYLAIFGSSVTFVLFTIAIREIGIARTNIFSNLIPVFSAIAAYYLLNEEMPFLKIFGIAVVLAGLIMSQVKSVKLRLPKIPAFPPN